MLFGKVNKERLSEEEEKIVIEFLRKDLERVIAKLVKESKEINNENIKIKK